MFTGIIRHTGTVTSFQPGSSHAKLTIGASKLAGTVAPGDSLCVNGVCLTVVNVDEALIEFDVVGETLRRSTLGTLRKGTAVNLEPSLRVGDSIDGHFVQGHVDGTAELKRRDTQGGEHVLWFAPDASVAAYLVPKGSVAIDGISLTIAEVAADRFSAAIIPTTLSLTTLSRLRVGDRVNVESDILARTVVHHLRSMRQVGGVTLEKLQAHGFA